MTSSVVLCGKKQYVSNALVVYLGVLILSSGISYGVFCNGFVGMRQYDIVPHGGAALIFYAILSI